MCSCHLYTLQFFSITLSEVNIYATSIMSYQTMEQQPDMEKQALLAQDEQEAQPEHEPTLAELQQNVFKAQRAYMRAWSRSTNGKWQKRIMLSVTGLLVTVMVLCGFAILSDTWDDEPYKSPRVPLEAHIMSKCPDARDCLHDMILPAMQNISHKVDFKLSYIGTYVIPRLSTVS